MCYLAIFPQPFCVTLFLFYAKGYDKLKIAMDHVTPRVKILHPLFFKITLTQCNYSDYSCGYIRIIYIMQQISMPICEMTLFHSCKSLQVTFLEMTLHKRWFVDTQRAMTEIIYEDDDIWQLCTMQGYCFVIIEQFKSNFCWFSKPPFSTLRINILLMQLPSVNLKSSWILNIINT